MSRIMMRLRWARYFASDRYGDHCSWCARHALTHRGPTDVQAFRWSLMAACRARTKRTMPS